MPGPLSPLLCCYHASSWGPSPSGIILILKKFALCSMPSLFKWNSVCKQVIDKLGCATHMSSLILLFSLLVPAVGYERDRTHANSPNSIPERQFCRLLIIFCTIPSGSTAFPWGFLFSQKNCFLKSPFLLLDFHSFSFNIYKPTRRTHWRTGPRFLERLYK